MSAPSRPLAKGLRPEFSQKAASALLGLLLLSATGCAHAPSFNILGSYFPSWIICCAGAAIITFALHRAFLKWNLLGELWPLPLVYTALFSFVSCTLWLMFFN